MEETKNTKAVILDRHSYRENDSLVTTHTQYFGKQVLVARGAKKFRSKLAGHLEPISLAEIMIVPGKNFDYVGAASLVDAYPLIKQNLNKLYFVGRAISWFNFLVKENQKDERLFFLLVEWLAVVNDYFEENFNRESGELLLSFFAWKLLTELGYQPETSHCLICQQPVKPGKNYFDLKNGGIISQECLMTQKKQPDYQFTHLLTISDNCIKMIRYIIDSRFDQAKKIRIDKKTIKELSNITSQFIKFIN